MRVEKAGRDDWRPIADTLADAFTNDPVMSWLIPNGSRRPAALRRFFAIEAQAVALPRNACLVASTAAGVVGAMLVLPPDKWRTPFSVEARNLVGFGQAFGRRLGHAFGLLTILEHEHIREPHYYLPFIGVRDGVRGEGVGSAMLKSLVARCDAERASAYLEATSPDNARLYRRHGFVTRKVVRPLGSPPIELMLRRPS
ncbi:MAG: GNAT family N-acetyltransferase [Nocardiaceae bacterium]|nr:GNAT family N-acetyltransferase [Nocardiaceae bacterium]